MLHVGSLEESDPVWKEGVFDSAGKWMDGWETRRKRVEGHDWALIRLLWPSEIHGVYFSTAYFTGNFTPVVSLQAACLSGEGLCFSIHDKHEMDIIRWEWMSGIFYHFTFFQTKRPSFHALNAMTRLPLRRKVKLPKASDLM